jgi:hypothetical protein
MTYSVKMIDGIRHVWSIMDNAWMPETEWDERERLRLALRAAAVDAVTEPHREERKLKERP